MAQDRGRSPHSFGRRITCDAYISYQVLENEKNGLITVTGCMMHCRRYLAEAFFVNDVAELSDEQLLELPEMKAYLINGARQLRIESIYPNRTLGYGALCLRDSLPG